MSRISVYSEVKKRPNLGDEERKQLEQEFAEGEREYQEITMELETCSGKIKYIMSLMDKLKKDGDVVDRAMGSYLKQRKELDKNRRRIVKRLGLVETTVAKS